MRRDTTIEIEPDREHNPLIGAPGVDPVEAYASGRPETIPANGCLITVTAARKGTLEIAIQRYGGMELEGVDGADPGVYVMARDRYVVRAALMDEGTARRQLGRPEHIRDLFAGPMDERKMEQRRDLILLMQRDVKVTLGGSFSGRLRPAEYHKTWFDTQRVVADLRDIQGVLEATASYVGLSDTDRLAILGSIMAKLQQAEDAWHEAHDGPVRRLGRLLMTEVHEKLIGSLRRRLAAAGINC